MVCHHGRGVENKHCPPLDMSERNILTSGQSIKPEIDDAGVVELAEKLYGLKVVELRHLDGYDDRNYWIKVANVNNPNIDEVWPHGYVLKILNSMDSTKIKFVEAQNELMLHLGKDSFKVPQPVKNKEGNLYSLELLRKGNSENTSKNVVRLLTFQVGTMLKDVATSELLLYNAGKYLAEVDESLKSFDHPAYKSVKSIWMLECVLCIREFTNVITEVNKLSLVNNVLEDFEEKVLPQMASLEKGLIHGDYNEHNILVKGNDVTCLLDFGDSHYGPYVFEVAIGLCYMLIQTSDIEAGKFFLAGYTDYKKLSPMETKLLKVCVCARLCQSLVLGAYSFKLDPGNEYILSSQSAGWKMLQCLSDIDEKILHVKWGL